jgi:hypothetical protein
MIVGQPCVNGGTCQVILAGRKKRQIQSGIAFLCQCLNVYTGTRCESFLSLCGSNPCRNNGTCFQDFLSNTIRCVCTPSFTGTFCNATTNLTNICMMNPNSCFNGGTCRVNPFALQGFSCICPPSITGPFCELFIDPCRVSGAPTCANNGTCVRRLTMSSLTARVSCLDVIVDRYRLCMSQRLHGSDLLDNGQSVYFSAMLS